MSWGGNLKPFKIKLSAFSGNVNTNGQVSANIAFPFFMVKKVELYSLLDYNYEGNITLIISGVDKEFKNYVEIEKKTTTRESISESTPLVIDLSNAKDYDFVELGLSGTNWNYGQKGLIKVYPR